MVFVQDSSLAKLFSIEVDRASLAFENVLGEGSFGKVWAGNEVKQVNKYITFIICLPLFETYVGLGFVYVRPSVTLYLFRPYLRESYM